MCSQVMILACMLGLATFFIIIIIAWLINYMIRFMMERRSKEFGTYLLLGMKKKTISKVYFRENIILSIVAFAFGIVVGLGLEQFIMTIFFKIMGSSYHIHVEVSVWGLCMTFLCYSVCFLLALLRSRKKIKKMNIADFMKAEKENQSVEEKHMGWTRWLLWLSILYFILFYRYVFFGTYTPLGWISRIAGYVIAIYGTYVGVASWVSWYVTKKGKGMYRGTNVFLLRQFSSKIKTMQFTMGTLSVLFSVALFGCTFAMMFHDYQRKQLPVKFPFDIIIHSEETDEEFLEEQETIEEWGSIQTKLVYRVYSNGTTKMNEDLLSLTNVHGEAYYPYDTYMGISDFNTLRQMIDLAPISLQDDEYAVAIKKGIYNRLNQEQKEKELVCGNKTLHLSAYYTEEFSLDGQNGADYVIVVPDDRIKQMTPMYSQMAVKLEQEAEYGLQEALLAVRKEKIIKKEDAKNDTLETAKDKEEDEEERDYDTFEYGYGSSQVMVYVSNCIVKKDVMIDMRFVMSACTFPLMYIGFVFLCVALTILAVQQLSDSTKYKFRYGVLSKLGLNKRQINQCVFRQLLLYYLCPILISIITSCGIALFASKKFIFYTGVETSTLLYYGVALGVFGGFYIIYFLATYIGFKRNLFLN